MGQGGDGERKGRMLFFSRSRADLGLTLWIAAAAVVATLVLFQIDDGNARLVEYNRHMKEATCEIRDERLEHDYAPYLGAPPDMAIPPKDMVCLLPPSHRKSLGSLCALVYWRFLYE